VAVDRERAGGLMGTNLFARSANKFVPSCFVQKNIARPSQSRYILFMHFSRHISQLHSTFSLLAALLLQQS